MESETLYLGKEAFQKIIQCAEVNLFNDLLHNQNYMDIFLADIGCKWLIADDPLPTNIYMILKVVDPKKWTIGRLKYNL